MSGRKTPRPQVKVQYVTVDGTEGEALEERQLAVIKEVLAWVRGQQRNARESEPEHRRAA